MSYQSEAKLEQKLIERLKKLNYQFVKIEDYDALLRNFRVQINKFNSEVLKGSELTDLEFKRLLNYMEGKSVYQCAKQLRDQFVLDRDDGTSAYLKFMSENYDENIYQVTNQVTVQGLLNIGMAILIGMLRQKLMTRFTWIVVKER